MDVSGASLIAQSLGTGVALGLSTIVGITLALLPASWVMNRFVYHTPMMRVILAIVAGLGSFLTFMIVFIGCATGLLNKPYYFGLLPIFLNRGGGEEPVGFFAIFKKLWRILAHPFQMRYLVDKGDPAGYKKNIEMMLVPEDAPKLPINGFKGETLYKGAVYELFFEEARKAGAAETYDEWKTQLEGLEATGIGQALFTKSNVSSAASS